MRRQPPSPKRPCTEARRTPGTRISKNEKKLLDAVLQAYGINEIVGISPIPVGTQGEKWKIKTKTPKSYVLKRLDAPKPKYLDYALHFQKIAADKALAPVLVPTTDGLMSVHRAGNDFVLEASLPGIPRPLTKNDAAQCGAMLGRLHLATCEPSHNLPISGAWEFLAGMAYAHIRAIVKTCSTWEQHAPGFLQHWTTSIESMSAFLADVSLPRGVHGDVNPTNMLWDGDVLRFCDFTNASPVPQFVDVAMGVIGLGILKWDFNTHAEVLPESISVAMPFIEQFLASYNDVRRLLPQEKAMLPDALRVLWGFWSYWFPATKSQGIRRIQSLSVELDVFAGTSFRGVIDQL